MSLRRQLIFSLITILLLFAANVGTHFWGSHARNDSMLAYRNSVTAAKLSTEVEQLLEDQRQQILILAALRETTDDPLEDAELTRAEDAIVTINSKIQELGSLSHSATEQNYELLWESSSHLLKRWLNFYRNYNNSTFDMDMNDPLLFLEASQRLKELEQRQEFIAAQRSKIVDSTESLIDKITIIAFFASIFLTATLGYYLVSYTNKSLKRLKKGTERFGSGDYDYRIDDIDDTGELGDLANAFNDMSDKLRNAIFEAEKARDDADEANAAKSIFLANVSHELRTPLNAIIGYSEMLHDELCDTADLDRPQFQQDLDIIIKSGRQLLTLIDDILDLSKIETGKMSLHCETFSPTEIIRQACEVLAPLLRNNNNELQLDELRELPVLYNDSAKFRQIFTNLLSNANKFTKGGNIRVSARELPDNPGWAEFSIRDTGIGMTSEQLARVFEAFVQADSSTSANYGGTGLGLTICRQFCDLMGGTIRAESEAGVGSTFTVLIPSDPE
jgi:signal transduction histidine kinase